MAFTQMRKDGSHYFPTFTNRYPTQPTGTIDPDLVVKTYNFAFDMSFGSGHHRSTRSGGSLNRRADEIFANTFQGKLAEVAIKNELEKLGYDTGPIDWTVHGQGVWDDTDIEFDGRKANIKSAKHFSNLLLLEEKDWNSSGQYIPNIGSAGNGEYDLFIFVRINPSAEDICRKELKTLYSDTLSPEQTNNLENAICSATWSYDIPGWISRDDLVQVISDGLNIIKRGEYLGQYTKMDATNYYVQSGDMRDFNTV